ncbi:MAG: type II toxin-antitoxin system RatA family toxin [Woeseiaceae bacterium]|nr:type II toxin-antitoxin system RatA family toxin [Woeseiaceae bacterium]
MRQVHRSALVTHSAMDMFALVDDIDSYPQFLPWCRDAEVHSRRGDVVEATLTIHRAGLRKSFRTRNTNRPGEAIDVELHSGPFRRLDGGWRFTSLGDGGSRVALDLEFEFDNRMLDLAFGRVFEEICNSLVDAFTRRADEVYG